MICRWREREQNVKHWEVCPYINDPFLECIKYFMKVFWLKVGGLNCIDLVVECFLIRKKYGQLCWYKLIWNAFFNGINLPRAFSNKWQQQTFFALKFIASMFFYFCSYLCFYWNHCWFVVCFLEAHLSVLSTLAFVSKSNNICFNSIFWWTNCCKKQTLPWTNISDIKK